MEVDFVHFYVTDGNQMRDLLIDRLGLQMLKNSDSNYQNSQVDEHTLTYLIGNPHLSFLISSPLTGASPVAKRLKLHPSGVKDIAFRVKNLDDIRQKIDRMGVKILADSSGDARYFPWLRIQGWESIEHTIIETPPSTAIESNHSIIGIDHLVLNVAAGELESVVKWYRDLFDFQIQQTFNIQTQRSGLASQTLISPDGKIRFNINEPISHNSQIQEFLDANVGAGIQHIALGTNNIFQTVEGLKQRGLAFLSISKNYYYQLQTRIKQGVKPPLTKDEWQRLAQLEILLDWTENLPEALLLQIFTQPIFDRPTFFFELIERRNQASGFGQGNFQALFEAIEISNQNHKTLINPISIP